MTDKPFTPEEFKEIYSRIPRLCIDLIIKSPEGIVLSLRSLSSWNGHWHFPGGTVLLGEKLEETVQRIAKNEIGVLVKVERFLGPIEYGPAEEIQERRFGHTISLAYLCSTEITDFKPNADASEICTFKAIPKNTIKEQSAFLKGNNLI